MRYLPSLIVVSALTLGGCTLMGERPEMGQLQAATAQAKETATASLEAAQASGDAEGAAKAEKALKAISELEKRLAQVTGPDGQIDPAKAVGTAGALLPPPWNLVALIGGPLVVGAYQELRRRRTEADAVSIINGLSAAQLNHPEVTAALKAAEPVIKKEYTPGALALVKKHKLASK